MLSNIDLSLAKQNLDIFWNLESIGIMDSPMKSDDDKALEMFNNTIKFDNGRYLVTWPWKESCSLQDNYQLAVSRLKSTLQRLKKNPCLLGICFRYVQSEDNPAYIATRGKSATEFSSFWWTGPQWLQRRKNDWPEWELPEVGIEREDVNVFFNSNTQKINIGNLIDEI